MAQNLEYGIRITADGSVLVSEAGKSEQALKRIGAEAERSTASASKFGLAVGAAAAAGVLAFGNLLKQTVNTAAALDDLSESTGSSVENLSALQNSMAVSGVDAGTFASLINKLAVGLSGVDDEGGKAGKALAALGVQSKDPAAALKELAQKLDQYADGANKAALLTAIFGRGAAQYAGALKDLARDTEVAATVTTDFAAEAEQLEKHLARSRVELQSLVTSIASELVPVLNEAISSFNLARAAGMGFFEALKHTGNYDLIVTQKQIAEIGDEIAKNQKMLDDYVARGMKAPQQTIQKKIDELKREYGFLQSVLNTLITKMPDRTPQADRPNAPGLPDTGSKAAIDHYLKGMNDIAEALKREEAERKKVLDGYREQLDLIDKLYEAQAKSIDGIAKETEGYQKRINALTLTKDELYALDIAKLQAIVDARTYEGYINAETEALQKQLDTLKQLRGVEAAHDASEAAQKAAEEWARAADSIGNSLTDALLRGFESGKDWAKNFVDTLKNLFGTLVLRPVIQAIVAPAAAGFTGMFGTGSASASGLGGAGSLLGGGNMLAGLGDMIFGGAGEFASGGMALASGLGAAVPIIGGALAIGMLVKNMLDSKKGGPKSGGFASSGLIGALTGADNGRWFTPNSADADVQAITSATGAAFKQALAALGGSGVGGFALGFDTDPQGTAPNRLHAGSYVNGRQVYDAALGDLGRDQEALQAALELETKRALLAALQASELPEQIAAVFDSVAAGGMSSDAIDNLLAYGAAMKAAIDAVGGSVVLDAQEAWDRAQRSSVQVLGDMGKEVIRLAGNVDDTAGSMQALATATGDYRAAVVQTLVAIKQIGEQVETMFAATRNSLETFGLSPEALYNRYRQDADTAMGMLSGETDPENVRTLAERINADINAAFGALSDEGKAAQKDPLLDYLNRVDAVVQGKLATITASVSSSTTDPFATVNAALTGASGNFSTAASSFGGSTSSFGSHVDRLEAVVTRFERAVQTPIVAVQPYSPVGS